MKRVRREFECRGKFLKFLMIVMVSVLFIMLLFFGCIDVPTEKTTYVEELSVHCLLRTDRGPSEVYVERTLDINAPELGVAVPGASVILSGNGREMIFSQDPYRPGVYFPPVSFLIHHGSTYTLNVTDPIGRNVTATTTVPGYFQILAPAFRDTIQLGRDIQFSWTGSEGAEKYYAYLRIDLYEDNFPSPPLFLSYALTDTSLIIPTERVPVEAECWIDIYAVDSNYAGYTRSDPEDPDSPDINHIPGAKGVFGSATNTFGFFYVR